LAHFEPRYPLTLFLSAPDDPDLPPLLPTPQALSLLDSLAEARRRGRPRPAPVIRMSHARNPTFPFDRMLAERRREEARRKIFEREKLRRQQLEEAAKRALAGSGSPGRPLVTLVTQAGNGDTVEKDDPVVVEVDEANEMNDGEIARGGKEVNDERADGGIAKDEEDEKGGVHDRHKDHYPEEEVDAQEDLERHRDDPYSHGYEHESSGESEALGDLEKEKDQDKHRDDAYSHGHEHESSVGSVGEEDAGKGGDEPYPHGHEHEGEKADERDTPYSHHHDEEGDQGEEDEEQREGNEGDGDDVQFTTELAILNGWTDVLAKNLTEDATDVIETFSGNLRNDRGTLESTVEEEEAALLSTYLDGKGGDLVSDVEVPLVDVVKLEESGRKRGNNGADGDRTGEGSGVARRAQFDSPLPAFEDQLDILIGEQEEADVAAQHEGPRQERRLVKDRCARQRVITLSLAKRHSFLIPPLVPVAHFGANSLMWALLLIARVQGHGHVHPHQLDSACTLRVQGLPSAPR